MRTSFEDETEVVQVTLCPYNVNFQEFSLSFSNFRV